MEKCEFSEVKSGLQQNALGAVLLQEEECKKSHVTYDSRKLKTNEKAYVVIEKECFALVWEIQKFHRYIYGTAFLVTTVHQPLSYLNKTKLSNPRLMRWALTLQPYEPVREISSNVVCATRKASDQPAHTYSLIRAFACRLSIIWLLSYWLNTIWNF